MNEVEIIITAENRTFQEFERVRRHIHGIADDLDKLSKSIPGKFSAPGTKQKIKEELGDGIKGGIEFGMSGIGDVVKAMPTEMKVAGAALGAMVGLQAASAAAAILTGGILAGAAAGAVIGGLKLAAQDPEVKAAGSALGERITANMQAMAVTAGFNSQAITSLDKVGEAWGRNSAKIRDAMDAAARYVQPLTDAVIAFGEEVLPSITKAVQRAEPVVKVLSTGIPQLGKGLGQALDDMTKNADEGAAALQMVFDITTALIGALGNAVDKGAQFFGTMLDVGSAVSGAAEDVVDILPTFGFLKDYVRGANDEFEKLRDISDGATPKITGFGEGIKGTAGETRDMERAARNATRAVADLNAAFELAFGVMMNVEESTIAVKLGFIEMREELKELGRFTDLNSEKGLRGTQIINDQISALERQRDAAIKAGDGSKEATDAANRAYLAGIDTLRKMLKDLGLLTPAMEAYLAKWRELVAPKTVSITAKVNVVESGGLVRGGTRTFAMASGGVVPAGAASGMMLGGGSLTKVGEFGEEYARFPPGTQIYNTGATKRIDAAMASGGAGGGPPLRIEVSAAPSFGSAFVDETIRQLRFRVRMEAGGDAASFFNSYAA